MKYLYTLVFEKKEDFDLAVKKLESTDQTKLPKSDSNESKCADCKKKIPDYVANFCKNNKDKFNNKLLCMTCQANYPKEE